MRDSWQRDGDAESALAADRQPPVQASRTEVGICQRAQSESGKHVDNCDDAEAHAWRDYQTVFTNAKAGMQGVDTEKVKRVVFDMSKGSAHFKNEQRKQAQIELRIARMKEKAAKLCAAALAAATKSVDNRIRAIELRRDLQRVWVHVDMDAFFCSVEELDQPEMKQVPMAVGGMGMISAANYMARKFGVRSAMPGFIAKRLCPELVFVRPDFTKYVDASRRAKGVLAAFDPRMEGGGLDEAYLDVTDFCVQHSMRQEQVAELIRQRVKDETRLTCSVGMAPNKMLAKICSDINKPDGQYILAVSRDAVLKFVESLPIRKIPGIGKVKEQELRALSIFTCQDLLQQRGLVHALFSEISSDFLIGAALGTGNTQHADPAEKGEITRKGISCERTFAAISAWGDLEGMAESLADTLAEDMAKEAIEGRTLTLKLKATTFELRTRAVTLGAYIRTPEEMMPHVRSLLKAELPLELRLMGLRMSKLRLIKSRRPCGQLDAMLATPVSSAPQRETQQAAAAGTGNSSAADATSLEQHQQLGQDDSSVDSPGTSSAHVSSQALSTEALHDLLDRSNTAPGCDALGSGPGCEVTSRPDADEGRSIPAGPLRQSFCSPLSVVRMPASVPARLEADDEHGMSGPPHDVGPLNGASNQFNSNGIECTSKRQRAAKNGSSDWTCRACTFAGNRYHFLRCEICDTPKVGPLSFVKKQRLLF